MTRTTTKTSQRRKSARRPAGKTLRELNAWITANHSALLKKARVNSVRLTGKPTFGGTGRRKSA